MNTNNNPKDGQGKAEDQKEESTQEGAGSEQSQANGEGAEGGEKGEDEASDKKEEE